MKKTLIILSALIILTALAYPKVQPLIGASSDEEQGEEQSNGDSEIMVDAVVVEPQPLEDKITATGTVAADEEVELRSEASGKVVDISLEEGKAVQKGDLLLKINDKELQAELKRTNHQLNLASDREQRQRRLLEKGGISQEDYDASLNEVNVLEAEVDLIEARIEETEVRAPFDGLVGLRYVSEGSYISPETRIASLQSIDPVKIDFSVPERYAGVVDEGNRISFTVQGVEDQFSAEIYAIEPNIDDDTRTLQLRARGSNPTGQLFPGAFANLELILEKIEDALLIPTTTIIPEMDQQKVFKYSNGTVSEQTVNTGIRTSESIQVLDGLSPGDTVLTTGLLQVRDGMSVQINETGEVELDSNDE